MCETMNHPIRIAIDDCLSGTESRPSLEARVLARVQGERPRPARLSTAMAMVFLLTLVSVAALAVGVLAGFFRMEQTEIGALQSCVSTGDVIYLMTTEGLQAWTPGEAEPKLLLSAEKLQERGISTDTLLYLEEDQISLLDQEHKAIWAYEAGGVTLQLDFKGTAMDLSALRYQAAVYEDGWLFLRMMPWDAHEDDALIYRADPKTGAAEQLALEGVLELCAYEPGSLLLLSSDIEGRTDTLLILNTATGEVLDALYTAPIQEIKGIAYDHARGGLYAIVGGMLSRWEEMGWTPLQGYAFHHLADIFAIVGDGYAAISFNDMQLIPFEKEADMTTLSIRGFISTDNADADFQTLFPSVAVVRERMPAITAEDVRKAILAGDTTDLFNIRLDGSAVSLFADGLAVPLTASDVLVKDAQDMTTPIAEGLYWEGELFAVPSLIMNLVWQSESSVPATFEDMLRQHASWQNDVPFIAWNWEEAAWTKADYADYLLTTYIAEKSKVGEDINFREAAFFSALTSLKEAVFPPSIGAGDSAAITPGISVSLIGDHPEDFSYGESRVYEPVTDKVPAPAKILWVLSPTVSEGAKPAIPIRLHVYMLNPNAQNPEIAMEYLEYIATHRWPEDEARMKPATAEPAMHKGVLDSIEWFVAEQREYDAKNDIKTDEAALQANIDAIYAAPDSWSVTADKLKAYRETIVPYLDLRLHPWLSAEAKLEGGTYHLMLQTITEYLNDDIAIEACLARLEALAGGTGRR